MIGEFAPTQGDISSHCRTVSRYQVLRVISLLAWRIENSRRQRGHSWIPPHPTALNTPSQSLDSRGTDINDSGGGGGVGSVSTGPLRESVLFCLGGIWEKLCLEQGAFEGWGKRKGVAEGNPGAVRLLQQSIAAPLPGAVREDDWKCG